MGRYIGRFDERRDFYRMAVDCPLTYHAGDAAARHTARCRNLSGSGVLFEAGEPFEPGTGIEFRIQPAYSLTGVLHALAQVVRCEPQTEQGGYRVAASILEIRR